MRTLPAAPSVLAHRSFLRAWVARVLSTTAYQMLTVAVGWQVYALTSDPLDLGWVGLVQFVPALLLVFVVGHVADRFDRRLVVMTCQLVGVLVAFALALLSRSGAATVAAILVVVFVFGAARAFEAPTTSALIATLVPRDSLPRALALTSSGTQAAVIVGPAIGGWLYALGATVVYAACALLFVAAAALVRSVPVVPRIAPREPVTLASVFAGLSYVRSRPALLGAISLDLFAVLLGGATALMPVFARDILDAGPSGLGMLRSAPAVGALAMSLWLVRHPPGARPGRTMFAAVAVYGLATIAFGLSRSFALSLATLVVLGASDMVSVVIRQSLVQLKTPDEMRGRVGAINALFIGTSNKLGEFESGVTAAWFGTVPSVLIGGVGTLLVVGAWMRMFPALTGMRSLRDSHAGG